MRKFYFVFVLFVFSLKLSAGGGIYETYMSFSLNSGSEVYYGTGGGNPTLQGANLGSNINLNSSTLVLRLRGLNSWNDGGCDVTSATYHYRIYKNTDPAPGFTALNLTQQGAAGNNKFWNNNSPDINLLSGLTTTGTYNFEVYLSANTNSLGGCPSTIFESNGGANFTATFTVTIPLPVKYKNFDVNRKSTLNHLQWTTASETNNDYFEIQHSTDGRNFKVVGQVKGYGNSNTDRDYFFSHEVSGTAISYYRLKQVDFDGKYEYSGIISVRSENDRWDESIAVSPNPVNDFLFVNGIADHAEYIVTDYSGRQIMIGSVDSGQSLDVATLAPGFYNLIIQEGTQRSAHKWIKQ